MKAIITLIVLIVSVVAYVAARKYQRRDRVLRTHKMKTEILVRLSELRVLQTHFLPIYGSEKVIEALANGSEDDYDQLRAAAEAFRNQLIECEEVESLLREADEDSLDPNALQETLIRMDEAIRHYRFQLNHLPPKIRDFMKGEK